ncbi:MAG: NAD-dependent epimerase/dehydratase family protein [Planctomycetaceae bacterium]|jgi:nucleoside-diphosphate-sugar epimerase|nr:NAD-dependent epimerase/dehydratase family protein [Planctomycetaceae bacterium]
MKYLITGGAGFIGSNLARYILGKGHEVVVLDNFATGKRENLAEIMDKIELIEGDVRDKSIVDSAISGCVAVFHEGALGSVPRSVADPVASHDANVNGTLTVLQSAREANVKRVVFAASSSAYGEQVESPKVETMPALPISPYAASKTACEAYMQAYAAAYKMETVSLRYFNVFGPRQDPFGAYAAVIPAFVSKILRGEQPEVFGDGEQTRDFCYIENVCYANWLAANAPAANCDGRPMNIACNAAVSLNQILNKLQQLMQKTVTPIYKPVRAGDVKHSLADISLAEKKISYKPLVYFDEGLERAINWYTENLK